MPRTPKNDVENIDNVIRIYNMMSEKSKRREKVVIAHVINDLEIKRVVFYRGVLAELKRRGHFKMDGAPKFPTYHSFEKVDRKDVRICIDKVRELNIENIKKWKESSKVQPELTKPIEAEPIIEAPVVEQPIIEKVVAETQKVEVPIKPEIVKAKRVRKPKPVEAPQPKIIRLKLFGLTIFEFTKQK